MKNKKTLLVVSFALAAILVIGQEVIAANSNDNNGISSNMSNMMNEDGIPGMTQMMGNENVQKMISAMNSPEGQEMMSACSTFMES